MAEKKVDIYDGANELGFTFYASNMVEKGLQLNTKEGTLTAARDGYIILSKFLYQYAKRPYRPEALLLDGSFLPSWVYPVYAEPKPDKNKNSGVIEYVNPEPNKPKSRYEKMVDEVNIRQVKQWKYLEPEFCEAFTKYHRIVWVNGCFFGQYGKINKSVILEWIKTCLSPFENSNIAYKAKKLYDALCIHFNGEAPNPDPYKVYVMDDTTLSFSRDGRMTVERDPNAFTLLRLRIRYNPEAQCPTFLRYLSELLAPDDIETLQQYMGYMLVPTTKVQKALFLQGFGGDGKSVLVKVVSQLLGNTAIVSKLEKLQENRFMLAELENRLAFIDDDLQTAGFAETSIIKEIITTKTKIMAERKGRDPHEFQSFARLFVATNKSPVALYDHTDGFFRRLLILYVLPVPAGRVDDPELTDKILEELEGVFVWALEGLSTLMANGWKIHTSQNTQSKLENHRLENVPVLRFLRDCDWVVFDPVEQVTTADFKKAFALWCKLNGIDPVKQSTVQRDLSAYLPREGQGVYYDNHIGLSRVRGYRGVGLTENVRSEMENYTFARDREPTLKPDRYSGLPTYRH